MLHRRSTSDPHLVTFILLLPLQLAVCSHGMIDNLSSPILPTTSAEVVISPDDVVNHGNQSRDCQPPIPGCVCFRAIANEEDNVGDSIDNSSASNSSTRRRSVVSGDWKCGLLSAAPIAVLSSSGVIDFPVELLIIGKEGERSNRTSWIDDVDESTFEVLCRLRQVHRLTVIGLNEFVTANEQNKSKSVVEDMIECFRKELVELTVRDKHLSDVFGTQRHLASFGSKDAASSITGFGRYSRMNLLDLSQNVIVSFEVELATLAMRGLEVLDLSGNQLSSLTRTKRCPQQLQSSGKIDSELKSPESNDTLMDLQIVVENITVNADSTTAPSSSNTETDGCLQLEASEEPAALRSFNASRNRIASIDTGLFDLRFRKLVSLDLSYNLLKTIENGTFVDLYSLRMVNLSHNNIEDMDIEAFSTTTTTIASTVQTADDAEIENDTAAGSLTIQRGVRRRNTDREEQYYIRLASCTRGWLDIQVVDLSHNRLTSLREGSLEQALCAVRRLLLSHNRLDRLPRYLFEHLPYLRTLDLSDNLITWLDVGAFTNPSLESLDLSGNRLRKIVSMTFLYLPAIRRIDLARNEISYIYKFAFYRMCSPNDGGTISLANGDRSAAENASFRGHDAADRRFEIALNENKLGSDTIWKILTTFEHLESPGCLVDVDLHENQIERFIPTEPLSFVRKRIEGALVNDGDPSAVLSTMQLFRRWDHITIDLSGNRIQCDCALLNEIQTVDQVVWIVANSSVNDTRRNHGLTLSWYKLNCSAPDEFTGITVMQFVNRSAARCRREVASLVTASFCPGSCECVKNYYHLVDNMSSVTMNCSGRHLNDFKFITSSSSSSIYRRVHTLDLSGNSFVRVEPDILRRWFPALRVLYLHDNQLTALPPSDRLFGQHPVSVTLFGNPLSCTACDEIMTIYGGIGWYDVIDWNRVTCSDGRRPVRMATSGRACSTVKKATRTVGGSSSQGASSPSDMVAVVPKTVLIVSLTLAIILVVLLIVTVIGLVTWSADSGSRTRYGDVGDGSFGRRSRFHFVDAVACRHLTEASIAGDGGGRSDHNHSGNSTSSSGFAAGGLNDGLSSDQHLADRDLFIAYCSTDAEWVGSCLLPVLRSCRTDSERIRLQSFDSRVEVESRQFLGDFRQNLDECSIAIVVVSQSFADSVLDGSDRSVASSERPEVLQLLDRHCRRSTAGCAFILINPLLNGGTIDDEDDQGPTSLIQGLLAGSGSTSCLLFSKEDEEANSFPDRLRHLLMANKQDCQLKQFRAALSRRKCISRITSSWCHWIVEAAGDLRRHCRHRRRSMASVVVEANEKLISASTLTERY